MSARDHVGWFVFAVAACGHGARRYEATGELAQGMTACGGSLSLLGDWTEEKPGELIATGTVAGVDRIEHGIRVTLDDARSFVIGLDRELSPPLAVGDPVDVTIRCEPIGWNALACMGTVVASGQLVAFNSASSATAEWQIVRGPLVERQVHANYGPTSRYGLEFTYAGARAISPHRGCVELETERGTFRVSGSEVEHADPRAPDSADALYYNVIRVR